MKTLPRLTKNLLFAGASLVASISGTASAFALDPTSDPYFSDQWQWSASKNGVNIVDAWLNGYTGSGIVIGIIDSWLDYSHEDLAANYSSYYSYDFVGSESGDDPNELYTSETHGTYVAGMAAAVGGNGIGGTGAAPEALLAGLHVDLTEDQIREAILYYSGVSSSGAYLYDTEIRIKNCSFGDSNSVFSSLVNSLSDETVAILDAVIRNNTILVFAAGNSRDDESSIENLTLGNANASSFQNYEGAIVVGATNSSGTYASFSNYGSNLFVCAPGQSVYSATRVVGDSSSSDDDEDEEDENDDAYYATGSGTSYATPIVSGVIALAAASNVAMDTRWVKWALAATSVQIDSSNSSWTTNSAGYHFSNDYGFGLIDAVSFIDYAEAIAYETIRGSTSSTASGGKLSSNSSVEKTIKISSLDGQNVESVELSVSVSGINYLSDLKIYIVSPTGTTSVVIDTSSMSAEDAQELWEYLIEEGYLDSNGTLNWTFVSNAFWGISETGEWKVVFENLGESTGTLGVTTLKINTGTIALESEIKSLAQGETLNIHALCFDRSSTNYTISKGATLCVEDSVILNSGTLNVYGTVKVYEESTESEWKGLKVYITGGTVNVYSGGQIIPERGTDVYSGTLRVYGGGEISGEITIYSGNVELGVDSASSVSFGSITMSGGTLSTSGNVGGTSVVMTGGLFNLSGTNSFSITANGGSVSVADTTGTTTVTSSVIIGATSETYGWLYVAAGATLKATSLRFLGNYVEAVEADEESVNYAIGSIFGKIDSALSLSYAAVYLNSGSTVTGNVAVSNGGILSINGEVTISGSKTISASGTTTESGLKTAVIYANDGSVINVGAVKINDGGVFYIGGAGVGTTTIVATGTADSAGFIVADGGSVELTIGDKLIVENKGVTFQSGAVVSLALQDSLPTNTIEFIELSTAGTSVYVEDNVVVEISQSDSTDIPTIWNGTENVALAYVITSTGTLEASLEEGTDLVPLRLTYSSFTSQQNAILAALRTLLPEGENYGISTELVDAVNSLTSVSGLKAAYNQFLPTNVVAINDIHYKQADALTGILDRRSRALRTGLPISDTWSEPLFGKYGFSFSADPNLVAATGFRQFTGYEYYTEYMFWANGGYSISHSDQTSNISKTKNEMRSAAIGFDFAVDDLCSVGIFAAYLEGNQRLKSTGTTTDASLRGVGIYAAGARVDTVGSLFYTGALSYGFVDYKFNRKVKISDYSSSATGTPNGSQAMAYVSVGYEWDAGNQALTYQWTTGPNLSIRFVHNEVDGYTENSSDAANRLKVGDFKYDSLLANVGWRATVRFDIQEFASIVPEFRIGWNHEFLDSDESVSSSFVLTGGNAFSTNMNRIGRDYLNVGVGITILAFECVTVSFDYDLNTLRSDSSTEHNFNLMLRVRF